MVQLCIGVPAEKVLLMKYQFSTAQALARALLQFFVLCACTTSEQSAVSSIPSVGATRAEIDAATIEILRDFYPKADLILDGDLLEAISVAHAAVTTSSARNDESKDLASRFVLSSVDDDEYTFFFFSKMYPEAEVLANENPPKDYVCSGGIACYRFGRGGNYRVIVDRRTGEVRSVEMLTDAQLGEP